MKPLSPGAAADPDVTEGARRVAVPVEGSDGPAAPALESASGVEVGPAAAEVGESEAAAALRLLGLDLSLTSSGWALPAQDAVQTGMLRPGSRLSGAARLSWVCERVAELVGEGPDMVSLALIEGYSFGSQGRATFSIGELGGAVRMTLHRLGVPFVEVPPAVLKKFAVGSGQASKDEVLLAAARRGGELFTGSSNDEADAFWLLAAGYAAAASRSHSVSPLLRMPAAQVAALEQVDWSALDGVLAALR